MSDHDSTSSGSGSGSGSDEELSTHEPRGDDDDDDHTTSTFSNPISSSYTRPPRTRKPPDIQIQSPTLQNVNGPRIQLDLPSPMNLHHLGITPLSPLRAQFASPRKPPSPRSPPATSNEGGSSTTAQEEIDGYEGEDDMDDSSGQSTADDVTQDSKDVLIERLTDLAQRLARSGTNVRTENITALHAQVDEMEKVLSQRRDLGSNGAKRPPPSLRLSSGESSKSGGKNHDGLGIAMSPSWLMSHFYGAGEPPLNLASPMAHKDKDKIGEDMHRTSSPKPKPEPKAKPDTQPQPQPNTISSEMADRIVQEAEKLCAEMQQVVTSLQARREESDHLHAILVTREASATKHIAALESRLEDLEDEVAENESELRFLRLQLRAIEVECHQYMPRDADPELAQSIRNWKSDWARLREKMASRRGTSFGEDSTFSTFTSPSAR